MGLGVILNERSGRKDLKDDLGVRLNLVKSEMATKTELQEMATKTDLSNLSKELKVELAYLQAIALGSAYAMMKAQSGNHKMMTTWMRDIENCMALGGEACHPIKEVAIVNKNRGKKN